MDGWCNHNPFDGVCVYPRTVGQPVSRWRHSYQVEFKWLWKAIEAQSTPHLQPLSLRGDHVPHLSCWTQGGMENRTGSGLSAPEGRKMVAQRKEATRPLPWVLVRYIEPLSPAILVEDLKPAPRAGERGRGVGAEARAAEPTEPPPPVSSGSTYW